MPAMAQPVKPPVVQGNVIALYAQGVSKRKIAKDLRIARATVDSILARYSQTEPVSATRHQQITPLAYDAVEKELRGGNGKIGMEWLKATVLQPATGDKYTINGDVQLQQALTLLPPAPAQLALPTTTSTTSTTDSPATASTQGSTRTEAAEMPPVVDVCLTSRTNFSQFSLADLEAEVARRKSASVIDVEVVEP